MSVFPLVYTIERGSGKDVYFGRTETYTAPVCAGGDKTVSCIPETRHVCSSYTRIFGCCDAADGGACGISVGCTHCTDEPTGANVCTCEKVAPPEAPPAGVPGQQQLLPIGTAGATVMQGGGGGGKSNVAAILLLVLVIGGIGYFVYTRAKGAARAAA